MPVNANIDWEQIRDRKQKRLLKVMKEKIAKVSIININQETALQLRNQVY